MRQPDTIQLVMKNLPKIIAFETSGRIGSIALAEGDIFLAAQVFDAPQTHSRQALQVAADLVRSVGWTPDDLNEVYVSAGPGSFNGLRVGITAAKTLAFALNIPVVAVPSTEVLALNAENISAELGPIQRLAVIMDAKRRQVFAAVFEPNPAAQSFIPGYRIFLEATVVTPVDLLAKIPTPLHVLGEGLRWHQDAFTAPGITCLPEPYWQPTAANVHRIGWLRARAGLYARPDELIPIYLRRPEAVEKWEQRHGITCS